MLISLLIGIHSWKVFIRHMFTRTLQTDATAAVSLLIYSRMLSESKANAFSTAFGCIYMLVVSVSVQFDRAFRLDDSTLQLYESLIK